MMIKCNVLEMKALCTVTACRVV